MNLDKYDCFTDTAYASFSFDSIGPNGTIKKIVNYQPIPDAVWPDGRQVINLGFGDWNEEEQKVDDSTGSNNQDRDKVLATVACTIISYCDKHGNLPIFAQGSSPARTRLYQMRINAHLVEVEKLFIVYGLFNGVWKTFEPGFNYDAFLVVKK
ncbi:DUF6934 family protein [Chitinophaga polysaccharea]|uniref:DUF6934 family protein n=1 Tax=Chitinophaga polysaccharea TaxID=1293035 RepID=UPI00115B3346|nr:hypothetical protein [Chitinophaga polysaccharea]